MTVDKILIDRAVVEQALEALTNCCSTHGHRCNRCDSEVDEGGNVAAELRAALEQPQPLPSPVWRLVPTTMTNAMAAVDKELRNTVPWIRWEAILAAAPQSPIQPPALKQPQVEQPVAYFYTASGRIVSTEAAAALMQQMTGEPGKVPLYSHPQPPRQPLTDQQIHDCFQHRHRDKATERRMITRAIERAHGIGGEA